MAIDMSQFYQVFFEESAEHLATMEGLLLELDIENPDSEQLNAVFRAAHSIKGSAGTFGFTDLAETTHILENLLDRIRKHELRLQADMVDAFLESGDLLREMLEAHQGRGKVDPEAVASICTRLRQLSADLPAARQPATTHSSIASPQETPKNRHTFDIQFVPTDVSAKSDGVPNLLDELRSLGTLEILSRPAPDMNNAGYWQLQLTTEAESDSFSDQIDLVAENGAWRVAEVVVAEDQGGAYGFFGDAPGAPQMEPDSFGLLDNKSPVVPAFDGATVQDDSYGFFDPLPPRVEDLSVLDTPVTEDGDGFGFFEPLSAEAPLSPAGSSVAAPSTATLKAAEAKAGETQMRARSAPATTTSDSSIRVSVEKVDQLINLVGELVITQAMLLQAAAQMQESAPERLVNGLTQLERNTRDLQESVMSIRMMQISFVFSRFPRVVRDLSAKLGKQVELKTSGDTTELDKGLIERIADPLTHLIRNSLDHGIELPDIRVAAGKSPVGTITLKAYHQGGNIVIEVGDDGAGLPRNKILAKARERGLPVTDQMTDQEVFLLIFEAGFSTAEQVTDVSGRGVGMDVVRRNIQSMGGRVEIQSMQGVGTRITVRLPLTLAILDGMSVAVGDQTYILPLSFVVESFQPLAGDIKTLSNQARVIQVRGEYLPVVVLHELFNIKSSSNNFTDGIMVVVDADGIVAALFVDALVGQHQVVIKSLEANYRRVQGISGATIMGDGHVALILDVSAIADMAKTALQKTNWQLN